MMIKRTATQRAETLTDRKQRRREIEIADALMAEAARHQAIMDLMAKQRQSRLARDKKAQRP